MKDYEYDNLFCKIPKIMQKSTKFAMIGEMDFCNFASIFPSLKGWVHHHSNPPCWTFAKSDFAPLWPLAKYWFRKGIVSAVINLPNSKAEETCVKNTREFHISSKGTSSVGTIWTNFPKPIISCPVPWQLYAYPREWVTDWVSKGSVPMIKMEI